MYNYLIITHLPVFYKLNLYKEISKRLKILVVFIAEQTVEERSKDFTDVISNEFDCVFLNKGSFQNRNKIKSILKLRGVLKAHNFEKILLSGWELPEFWYACLTMSKSKNCLALESTVKESQSVGIKGLVKKFFLKRTSIVFASGNPHKQLLNELGYSGKIKITEGVGIINKPLFSSSLREYRKRFLYVGRIAEEKNLEMLVSVFNDLEDYKLTIIGSGPLESKIRGLSKSNIKLLGQVENKKLKDYFLENDIFILPSIRDTWGLVVEEALYFEMPVLISEQCGSVQLVKDGENGYVFNPESKKELIKKIQAINKRSYKKLVDGTKSFSIDKKDERQVNTYFI